MKQVLLIILGAALIGLGVYQIAHQNSNQAINLSFKQWQAKYHVQYTRKEEEEYRQQIYETNLNYINAVNSQQDDFKYAPNQFMDLSNEEFKSIFLTLKPQNKETRKLMEETPLKQNSTTINWVQAGAVTPIKNQGSCGSCYTFSTTGCLEGVSFIWGGGLQSFSEQQLVDCSTSYGNQGCNGGLMDYCFEYVIANGITTESAYPYVGYQQACKQNGGPFKIASYTDVPSGNCNALLSALATQPISIAVDAQTWQFYSTGVFKLCGTSLDHGVLLVGYYPNSYWLVKNSWGTTWGMQGYIELALGNTCGLCNEASFANYK